MFSLTRWRNDDRGDAGGHALELLAIAGVMLVFVMLLVAFGRAASTSSKLDAAAASAARAASQQTSQNTAQTAALTQAERALADAGLRCGQMQIDVDTSAFSLLAGQPGEVIVEISCTLDLSDIAMPMIPGSARLTGRAASPVDTYQERQA